mgnify:CR=1 FL=1|jgi:hypothetical protein
MGLKVATFTYTNERGLPITAFLTWAGIDIKWRETNYVRFAVYASETDSEISPPIEMLYLPVPQEEVLALLQMQGVVGLAISDRSWELAATTPFVPDFSTIDQDEGKRVRTLRSLTDLEAEIIDIGLEPLLALSQNKKGETRQK